MSLVLELLHFSHFHHVSLIQWTNSMLTATGGSGSRLWDATHTLAQWNQVSPVSDVSLNW